MSNIHNLEPKPLWGYFHEICQIPHPSKKEKRIVEFIKDFGKKNNLETVVDKVGNVIIRKPAVKGMENRKGVIFQSHLDMVPQKNSDKKHDFEKDKIETIIDGEWVRANGTTLGSDNGIGVSAAMAVLAAKNIKHGPLEALFTIDEETGMTGAFGLKKGLLKGDILMNLDSEDEGELYVGCAGGIDVSVSKKYAEEKTPRGLSAYRVVIKGLKGGHSGVDIQLGRANSNKLMFRFLMQAESDFSIRLSEAAGGDLRNAIPRESYSLVLVSGKKIKEFEKFVRGYEKMYRAEFAETEPTLSFRAAKVDLPSKVMKKDDQYKIIRAVYACPNGVQRMSQAMKGLVETSNNLAIVKCAGGKFEAHNLTRSSVDSAKEATAWKIAAVFHLIDAEVTLKGSYPGWKPNMQSPVLNTMSRVYKDMYGKTPEIKAIHAGLECGILGGAYPNLDMISFGPTIRYPHSPDEKVNIASVGKFWDFLVETLRHIPVK
ncbi:MAG: cytosol nonspecific dipeptidase [Bacteroidetes bacterium GWE2_41_25]|nr:MAG: cytosol nonspecific dipeptidase [Bacteroidetes bacterium GWA2_40_15]OFX92915.1 MAG: cytosol nonspecific dipeptidase [Bacteroidetes bacterium GWC2_40_22]OFY09375.1 MAG: cytosol nonspecific dipeptidase [Bacteroidetes bacterium GWE2_41_25]OFY59618.1 MAG: cytosol nonspecific dipeptidase [Bacteroidetes bacterium GWF2_41_9]HAM10365.1 cytosol nonspecific dipeptidase [Bacteroidales bacterium]